MDKLWPALLLAVAAWFLGGCMRPKEHERDVRGTPAGRVEFCNTAGPPTSVKAG
ncbi:MAG TPA: hypothetical protein VNE39_17255 [Planctomycetota bacterium]|nr:hypothetical protein [Planctomycetota bacterium]